MSEKDTYFERVQGLIDRVASIPAAESIEDLIRDCTTNTLWNWPHLGWYCKRMCEAGDELERLNFMLGECRQADKDHAAIAWEKHLENRAQTKHAQE